jgi:quinol monooxygenase YgiN
VVTYLRCTVGRWKIDLGSDEAREAFRLIDEEGVRVFRSEPGFVRYRLMVADPSTTIAVAEWESEELGKPGAQRYMEWLSSSGIAEKLSLETYDGEVVAAS